MSKRAKINQINDLLQEKGKSDLLISDEESIMMTDLVGVLRPFKVAIKMFEKEKEPTIQHVLPQFYTLKKHVAPRPGATFSSPIAKLRALLDEQLTVKYLPNIADRHKVGAFLWPMCAELPFLPEDEREQRAVMLRRGLLDEPGSPGKRRRTRRARALSDEEQYADILGENMNAEALDEVDKYLLIVRTTGKNVKFKDLLKWWKERSSDLPIHSRVVRVVLATPASSSASERNFSVAGRLITPRRNMPCSRVSRCYAIFI
ncbi:E3 SUMO-protein ligase ZBED1 [Frankliniella fusca]|uniref:E3 SUMO-protein ligase ZBED1 n=1 Tax=Frankliniella fusca TaxID=407009 RepID=A0AAE1HRT5_9NEOP|nr:E3 SUMO-protein ligase ZBED1 [Frankliniella fusca]